MVGEFCSRKT
jgi:hypothetical protein